MNAIQNKWKLLDNNICFHPDYIKNLRYFLETYKSDGWKSLPCLLCCCKCPDTSECNNGGCFVDYNPDKCPYKGGYERLVTEFL